MAGNITRLLALGTASRRLCKPNHAANQAHLRSHSGPCASLVLFGLPTSRVFEVKPHLFRTITLGRLRLPLMITEARCACRGALDVRGQHKAACPRSGRPHSRAVRTERTLAQVCREAGATVRYNTKLRDMSLSFSATDEGAIEVLASGLPVNHCAERPKSNQIFSAR